MSSEWAWKSGFPSFCAPNEESASAWNRRLWGAELAFGAGTLANPGFADLLMSCHIHLPSSFSCSIEHVRLATQALRWHHPAISATLSFPAFESPADFYPDAGRLVYQAPSGPDAIEVWLSQVVHDRSHILQTVDHDITKAIKVVRHDIGASTTPRSKWMFEVHYIGGEGSATQAVILHLGHTLFDAIGCFEVLDLWLHELAKVIPSQAIEQSFDWGEEGHRLANAVPGRATPPSSSEITSHDSKIMLARLTEALKLPAVQFGLPVPNPTAPPTFTGTLLKQLPRGTAMLLRNAARAHDCAIFSVILAANYLTTLRLNPPAAFDEELYAGLIPNATDLRGKYLVGGAAAKRDRSTWEVTSALGATVIVARHLERFLKSDDPIADAWTLAGELQEQVNEQLPFQVTASQWVPELIGVLMTALFHTPPAIQNDRLVNLSSLGVVDDSLAKEYPTDSAEKAFEISDPVFSGVGACLPPRDVSVVVHPYTWDGIFYFSFSFPTAYLGSLEEQAIAEKQGKVTLKKFADEYVGLIEKLAEAGKLPN